MSAQDPRQPGGYGPPAGQDPPPQQQDGHQQYGHQRYGHQQYGQEAYRGHEDPRRTNTMAILSLVFAFVFFPLGIVFGFVARSQIKRTHEEGSGLALAGIIVGFVVTALVIAYVVLIALFVGNAATIVQNFSPSPIPTF